MRRKQPPQLERATAIRPLSAARYGSRLPTAAALAFALASLAGCAARPEEVQADPVAEKASPIASAQPGTNVPVDPEPHPLPGEPAIVAPVASVSAKPKPKAVTVPTIKPHRTAGVPMHVKGSPHDQDF